MIRPLGKAHQEKFKMLKSWKDQIPLRKAKRRMFMLSCIWIERDMILLIEPVAMQCRR